MTYEVIADSVSGGALVVQNDSGTKTVIAKCVNSTVAGQIVAALSA